MMSKAAFSAILGLFAGLRFTLRNIADATNNVWNLNLITYYLGELGVHFCLFGIKAV